MKLSRPGAVVLLMLLFNGIGWGQSSETEKLQQQINEQGKQIEELQRQLALIERMLMSGNTVARIAATEPVTRVIPISTAVVAPAQAPLAPAAPAQTPVAPAAQPPQIAGFRFGADFRLRFDAIVRPASEQAGGVQNIRQRYRARLNVDRDIAPDLNFHLQLSTGAVNNGITLDQDFAGSVTRQPFFISEAFIDYRPRPNVSLRGGRMEEVFADNSRFLFDDDVRFNGFHQKWRLGRIEFRAGQYLLINPNVFSVPPSSPLTLAGVTPNTIARASQMFHQGVVIDKPMSAAWRSQVTAGIQLYRNPNLIAFTSNPLGVPIVLSPAIGLTLSGPAPGTGNATTTPFNSILYARHYQVAHASYRLDGNQLFNKPQIPMTLLVQVARNVGTSQLRDAVMGSISIGRTQEAGEVRGMYVWGIKDANSMISQYTDDDFGTGVGTNIATNHFRLDVALRRGIVFQNLVFRQTERRSSNPQADFFVPLGSGTPPTWRYQGQLAISF